MLNNSRIGWSDSSKIPAHTGCRNCGECCGLIGVFPREIERILAYLCENPDAHRLAIAQQHRLTQCPFRDNSERKCAIYPARPITCKLMGVCKEMHCIHGNSRQINGKVFIDRDIEETFIVLNMVDWRDPSPEKYYLSADDLQSIVEAVCANL